MTFKYLQHKKIHDKNVKYFLYKKTYLIIKTQVYIKYESN